MNPLFQKVITGIEQQTQERDQYDRIVVAGLKLMFNQKTHAMLMEGVDEAPSVAVWAGKGVVGILGMLAKQARGTMPFEALIQSGVTLLMHALDFLAESGKVEATPAAVAEATKAYGMEIMKAAGVSEDQMMQMAEKANAAAGDPAVMQRFAGRAAQPSTGA